MSVTRRKRRRRSQRGVTLLTVIVAIVALMGTAALGLDIAMIYATRQRAQNVADAASLAAAAVLPDTTAATAAANAVIAANNTRNSTFISTGITFTTAASPDVTRDDGSLWDIGAGYGVTVSGYIDAPLSFSAVVGYSPVSTDGKQNNVSVKVNSTAVYNLQTQPVLSLPSGSNVLPWVVTADQYSCDPTTRTIGSLLSTSCSPNTPARDTYQPQSCQVTLSVTTDQCTGNFACVDHGSGSSGYQSECIGQCAEAVTVGDSCNQNNSFAACTQSAITTRLTTSASCTHNFSCYTDWFFGRSTYPVDNSLPPVCDNGKTYCYYQDPHRQEQTDARCVVLPLTTSAGSGWCSAPSVTAFGVFFIESNCTDRSNNICTGRFIGVNIPKATGGNCPSAGAGTSASSGTTSSVLLVK